MTSDTCVSLVWGNTVSRLMYFTCFSQWIIHPVMPVNSIHFYFVGLFREYTIKGFDMIWSIYNTFVYFSFFIGVIHITYNWPF